MRITQEGNLPDSATILRPVSTPDAAGGQVVSYSAVNTVLCRVAKKEYQASQSLQGGEMKVTADFVVTMAYGTDVRQTDRLQVGGVTYEIVKIQERSQQTVTRADVVRL